MKNITGWIIFGIIAFGWLLRAVITWQWWNNYYSFTDKTTVTNTSSQKIYIANEDESSVTVVDASNNAIIKSINLSQQYYGKFLEYSAHNVQVSPDGKILAVTANIAEPKNKWGHEENMSNNDQVVLIDPLSDLIVWRIDIEKWAHLAHVVIDNNATRAYAVSQEKSKLYVLSLDNQKIEKTIDLPSWSQPHGIRLSPDWRYLFIAFIWEKALGILDIKTDELKTISVWDKAMQVAVSPDNSYVFASLYTSKRIARYNTTTKITDYINLPKDSQWPIQIYPSPDSRYLYVADQGFYFDEWTGHQIYQIDVIQAKVVSSFTWWDWPHGILVSPDGNTVYASNLLSNSLTIIDIRTKKVINNIQIGKGLNGRSIWTKWHWLTP